MRCFYCVLTVVLLSCGISKQEVETTDNLQPESGLINAVGSLGTVTVESTILGKNDADFWEKGLKVIEYRIIRNDSTLATIKISPSDIFNLYNRDFSESSKIWDSEVLAVDEKRQRISIINNFGQPESDNLTAVIVTADFNGTKTYRDSPPECESGINYSFNKIVDCSGVYDFEKPILEFNHCCTVFSDLINNSTLFYVLDWADDQIGKNKKNAFLLNIYTKDTLDGFVFKDYYQALGYSALIRVNKKMGILALLQLDKKELTTWDSTLIKNTYNLAKIKSFADLTPTANFTEMYHESLGQIIIEFDEKNKPIRWNQ
ncbi:MAG: hypothetical protein J0L66_06365 [Cytophagales bacterium]|nr:hypothetical protein [Cytophagales bacterium]